VAALKLLQPVPLCPDLWEKRFSEIGSIFARDRGGSLERFHRPNRFKVWLHDFQWGEILNVITGLDLVHPQCGPYEASEGIYPGRGQKNWGGQE
jgi:hypothetical protein